MPRPRHSLSPRLQRVAPPRLGQAMRRWCLTRFTKGKISLSWVSPRTRGVAQFDLTKCHHTLTFAQLNNCWVGGRRVETRKLPSLQRNSGSRELSRTGCKMLCLAKSQTPGLYASASPLLARVLPPRRQVANSSTPRGAFQHASLRRSGMHRFGVPAARGGAYKSGVQKTR